MTIYISGPITGMPDGNRAAFNDAEKRLKRHGDTIVNPVTIGDELKEKLGREPTWKEYMLTDLEALFDCDTIYMLNGWENSNGARIEYHVAKARGCKVYFEYYFKDSIG